MKRFCISAVLFFLAAIALIAASALFLPYKSMKRSLLGMQAVKLKRLADLPGRRIVFAGGSNLSHGLDSPAIERELGVGVVNMGVHAGLGLRYILLAAVDGLREGDLVVVVPEYGHFGANFLGNAETLAMVCDVIPAHKRLVSARQWLRLVEFLPRYGAGKLCRLHKCFSGGDAPPIAGYNAEGDKIPSAQTHPNPDNKGGGKATDKDFNPDTIRQLNDCLAKIRSTGAEVVFLPPSLQRTSYERQRPFVETVAAALEANGTPFLVPPESMVLDDEFFLDTPYHLNIRGYPIRTRRVISALRPLCERTAK